MVYGKGGLWIYGRERERERESGEGCVGVLCVLWLREWVGGSDPSLTILAFCSGRGGRVINAWNV